MSTNKKIIMTIALLGALSAFVAFATIPAITPVGSLGHGTQNAYAMNPCTSDEPPTHDDLSYCP